MPSNTRHRMVNRPAILDYNFGFIERTYLDYIKHTAKSNLITVWPMNESIGSVITDYSGNGRHGVYRDDDMINLSRFVNDSKTPQWIPANSDTANMYSTSLRDALLYTKGSFNIWCKVRASSVWSDATNRTLFDFRTSVAGNIVRLQHPGANNNRLVATIRIGGVSKTPFFDTPSQTRNDWFMFTLTWSDSANGDSAKIYYNAAQQSTTQTGFGAASTPVLSSQYASIGNVDNNTPSEFWDGYFAYASFWSNHILTQTEITGLFSNRFLA